MRGAGLDDLERVAGAYRNHCCLGKSVNIEV